MEFAEKELNADGRAALALVAGLIKVFRDDLDKNEVLAVFEHAMHAVPNTTSNMDVEARDLILALRNEMAPE